MGNQRQKSWELSDPHWYKDAVIYEVRLRSFFDANSDGIGDLKGLTEKLDYIQDLGVNTIWLLPFYPSPLMDDGYDIADYGSIHPELGNLQDFKKLLAAAHARGLHVVTELVLNHTSDQHFWFQRARKAARGSKHRDFYVWSDDPSKYAAARVIFQDFESSNWTWDPVAGQYFWHRFYSNQPDLNFENGEVQKAVLSVVDFWLGMGVDGLRLDAVPYLFEEEGTNCENLPKTHEFLRKLRAHIDAKFPNRLLLAEANQWPEDAVAYFGKGDECHMCFHFPIMPRLFMGLRMEDNFPILDILEQTPNIPEGCQWAIFLRNHDELTLEMVTDEERDYMVSVYAADRTARVNLGIRRRLAPLLENHRGRIELMNALLFSLPGTPVLYYGDEIGMGDNVYLGDRNGVRTPMQWNGDRNAGFSTANPQRLVLPPIQDPEYHYSAINVEAQQQNSSSLLWWTKRLIDLRTQFSAFGRGTFEPLFPKNRRVLSFLRRHEEQVLLIVVNLSRFAQFVELDLSEFQGAIPRELFGNGEFPTIGEPPYVITLGPHGFYWFSLRDAQREEDSHHLIPSFKLRGSWENQLLASKGSALSRALARYVHRARWFRDKSRVIKSLAVKEALPLARSYYLLVLHLEFTSGEPSRYCLPVTYVSADTQPENALVELKGAGKSGYLVDAGGEAILADALFRLAANGRTLRGNSIELVGVPSPQLRSRLKQGVASGRKLATDQTNSSYVYQDEFVMKMFRLLEREESLELEVLRQLERSDKFKNYPKLVGHIEMRDQHGMAGTLAVVQSFVENQGDAWTLAVHAVAKFYEEVLAAWPSAPPLSNESVLKLAQQEPTAELAGALGTFLPNAELLGLRTAEMHLALADYPDPEFVPDTFGALAKRAFYQSIRNLAARATDALRASVTKLRPTDAELARRFLKQERVLRERMAKVRDSQLTGARIRVHGDLHLGQVLHTGKDFVILDFEGEPARGRSHRRGRRSPMADVAGMLRSFHYAAHAGMHDERMSVVRESDRRLLTEWAELWQMWMGAAYMRGYLSAMEGSGLLPQSEEERELLLDTYILEKALYELGYELDNRPDWVSTPLQGLLSLLDG